jgi:TonB family protein
MVCQPTFAQNTAPAIAPTKDSPAAAAMPSDPKGLMLLASKANRLTGNDMKPWHLKATYKVFDEKGIVTDQGTYEEFWASPTRYKLTLTNTTASQTEYGTEKGILIPDNEKPVNGHDIRPQLLFPMGTANWTENADFTQRQVKLDGEELRCFNKKYSNGSLSPLTLCLDAQMPILRASSMRGNLGTTRNRIITFQSHYITGDLTIFYGATGVKAIVHLDSIEALNPIDEAIFTPPSNYIPQKNEVHTIKVINVDSHPAAGNGQVHISSGVAEGLLVKQVPPDYPPIARAARVQGTVVLQAIISKDGHITNLHVISGPAMLQQAALDAVKQWTYKPYLLYGQSVEVQTTVNVIFTLRG